MTHGTLGIRPGIGDSGRAGGTHIHAGPATYIGVIATLTIIAITAVLSVTDVKRVEVIMSYAVA